MRKDLNETLMQEFPFLYGEQLKRYGFACGDGWYALLYTLSTKLEKLLKELPPEKQFHAVQVKEKFGTLRFYTSPYNEAVESLIREAENVSARTCEWCGDTGKLRSGPGAWWRTLCNSCDTTSGSV